MELNVTSSPSIYSYVQVISVSDLLLLIYKAEGDTDIISQLGGLSEIMCVECLTQ